MSDTMVTIIAIFLASVLMFILPLLSVSERGEDVSQLAVQTATQEFVDKVATKGVITKEDYDAYVQALGVTGNTYDIEIEVQHLDGNPSKKSAIANLIGENLRYSEFTSTILNALATSNGKYELSKGDNVIVSVKNTNTTLAQLLRNFVYSVTGNENYQVGATASSLVVNNGR